MKFKYLKKFNITKHFTPGTALLLAIVLFASSCGTTRRSEYFQNLQKNDTTLQAVINKDFESKIIPGDRLSITMSSLSIEEDRVFNLAAPASGTIASVGATVASGFTVESDGTIFLHRLGKTPAAGSTRRQLAKNIESKIAAYAKEPIVQVNYINHKLTVLGAVARPQVLNLPEEEITIVDAIVLSGDVLPNANKSRITIIREEGNEKKVTHVNLEDQSIFSSPSFYLKPNDIVLVPTDYANADKEERRRRLQTTLSLVASGVGLIVIVIDRLVN